MDKTKSKLAAFFDNDDDESSFPQKEVDGQKRSVFTQGVVRKSKREKEKEAAEAKRKEEEENAARAYAEFLDAFQGEGLDRKKAGSAFVKAGESSSYAPAVRGKAAGGQGMRAFEMDSMQPPSPPPVAPKPKGKRAMDHFLEEIKREQADREARLSRHVTHGRSVTSIAAYEGQSGSKDRGDPQSTNIFVANLPPHVTEQSLGTFFARCGSVGSVKIMWPRGDATQGPGADMTVTRRTKNAGLSGFVSYMKRKDAEAALRELDGFDWGGSVLRVGWSKAVPIAAKPLYVMKKTASRSRSRSKSRSRSRSHERSYRRHSYSRSRSRSRSRDHDRTSGYRSLRRSRSRSRSRDYSRSPSGYRRRSTSRKKYDSRSPRRRSASPRAVHLGLDEEEISDRFIRLVAAEVKGHDAEYEESLKEREKSNPRYAFLKRDHRRNKYYRSLLDRYDSIEPEFEDEGYNSIYSTDSAEESEREHCRKNELGKRARKRFEAMLRALSGKRGEIARCMAFSLEHAEAAAEVSDIIVASLVVDGTPVPRKVARLHLICDILHNSAAPLPMAWKFRQEFQSRLGLVFDHLSTIYHSFPGRITAETFKKQITSVVDIWEDWIVFSPDFTAELRARLEGSVVHEAMPQEEVKATEVRQNTPVVFKFKASSFKPADEVAREAEPTNLDSDEGEQMDLGSDEEKKPSEDVDGEPIAADIDGEPIDDVDGVPIDDLDGAPMDDIDGDPIDGDPIDGDPIDGEPIDGDPIDGEPIDGEPIDGEPIDGEPMQEDIDGVPVDV